MTTPIQPEAEIDDEKLISLINKKQRELEPHQPEKIEMPDIISTGNWISETVVTVPMKNWMQAVTDRLNGVK